MNISLMEFLTKLPSVKTFPPLFVYYLLKNVYGKVIIQCLISSLTLHTYIILY
uniref:Uncharacterized protein n=1 Tax=Meloidogyne enterolobii TaxID=390850 RepID=A0A6V7WDU3_MELEN|nr:unnamed protein product [Meloidogyne enterolobii]